jgi:acyl-CoA thioester hydrolase
MARIKIELPAVVHFTAEIAVRIGDINYGNHLGNDSLLSLIHEGRVRFLAHYGYAEMNIEGASIFMNDVAVVYKAEAFYGDILTFEISVIDFHRFGCDLVYKVANKETATEVARAKTGIVFYDYGERKLIEVPKQFTTLFR